MPYISEKTRLPRELKRNIKLSQEDREEIRLIKRLHHHSYNEIARAYGVSKRLIMFVCNPEVEKACRQRRKELASDGRYYNKEKNTAAVRNSRRYKHELYNQGVIKIN